MPRADGVAYRTRPASSTIRMTSEVSWTRVRKYASLLRRITSRLSSTRSTTSAACRASTSNVPASSARSRLAPDTASTPISGSPAGLSCRYRGQSRTLHWSPSGLAVRRAPGPVSSDSQLSAWAAGSSVATRGWSGGAPTTRRVPPSRTATTTGPRWRFSISEATPDRTALGGLLHRGRGGQVGPGHPQDPRPGQGPAERGGHVGEPDRTRTYSSAEQTAITPASWHPVLDGLGQQHRRGDQ